MKEVGLVTGASSGIGKELARIHASRGRDLVLVARREQELAQLSEELESSYKVKVRYVSKDLMVPGAALELAHWLEQEGIVVEYLFNNAGLGGYGKFHERELVKEQQMIQLNITFLTELTHLLLPGMIRNGRGRILNTASTAGMLPGPLQTVYYATKAYVISFSQGIARELKGTGVTVTALCPGPVNTGFEEAAGMANSGLFKNAATAESTAMKGYRGMENGKLIVITDLLLKFALNWIIPFSPRRLVLRTVENLQKIK